MIKTADHDETDSQWLCVLNHDLNDTARAIYYFTRVITSLPV